MTEANDFELNLEPDTAGPFTAKEASVTVINRGYETGGFDVVVGTESKHYDLMYGMSQYIELPKKDGEIRNVGRTSLACRFRS